MNTVQYFNDQFIISYSKLLLQISKDWIGYFKHNIKSQWFPILSVASALKMFIFYNILSFWPIQHLLLHLFQIVCSFQIFRVQILFTKLQRCIILLGFAMSSTRLITSRSWSVKQTTFRDLLKPTPNTSWWECLSICKIVTCAEHVL